jgi:serine/threonine-protein kinase RsbW
MMRRSRSTPARATLSVPGTAAGVRQALDAFTEFSRSVALPADRQWRFLVAMDEVLSNVISHGRHDAAIHLGFSLTKHLMKVEIVDSAEGFNPLLTPAPDMTAPLEDRRPGGLGIAIVRGLMDRVVYERRAGRNRLALTSRIRDTRGD